MARKPLARFRRLVAIRRAPSRWWYLPFLLVMGAMALLALGEGLPGGADYLVVFLVLSVQTARPTALGWWATLGAWFGVCFAEPLYARIAYEISGFTPTFLFAWGVVPLILLWLIRPRERRPSASVNDMGPPHA